MKLRLHRAAALHIAVVALLFVLQFVLTPYDALTLTRVMVIAVYAMGYNVLFGYTGLLSLGHSLFFAAGLYGAGMPIYYFGVSVPEAFLIGIGCSALLSVVIGAIALRTSGVAFMIVTLMFAQAGYLLTSYFIEYTQGDAGLSLTGARAIAIGSINIDFANAAVRYNVALASLALAMLVVYVLVQRPGGRVLIAVRENEERTRMLGYDIFRSKLTAFVYSGTLCGGAGVMFALLFGYVGSSFASIQFSIEALLYTLLGGAGTVLGPLIGTAFMMFLVDKASEITVAYLLLVGIILIVLIMWFPKGILGTIRERWAPWIP